MGLDERAGGGSRSSTVAYQVLIVSGLLLCRDLCVCISCHKLTPRYLWAQGELVELVELVFSVGGTPSTCAVVAILCVENLLSFSSYCLAIDP